MQNNNCGGWGQGPLLTRINRISAWVLFITMLAYFVSGYGMTRGIIDSNFATRLHVGILPPFVMASFVLHSFLSIRIAFMRWRIWNRSTLALASVIFAAFSVSFIYVEMLYSATQAAPAENAIASQVIEKVASSVTATTAVTNQKVFNAAELAKYNGKNGAPAYVAVDGLVYDMSRVFRQGTHFEHIAGTELTKAFYSYHVKGEIVKYPVVGIFNS
jgi:predicted heme/steroid binding protein